MNKFSIWTEIAFCLVLTLLTAFVGTRFWMSVESPTWFVLIFMANLFNAGHGILLVMDLCRQAKSCPSA